jgi:hypothetical protein
LLVGPDKGVNSRNIKGMFIDRSVGGGLVDLQKFPISGEMTWFISIVRTHFRHPKKVKNGYFFKFLMIEPISKRIKRIELLCENTVWSFV